MNSTHRAHSSAAAGLFLFFVTGIGLASTPKVGSGLDAGTVTTQQTGDCSLDEGGDPCIRLNGCPGATACVNGKLQCLCGEGGGTKACTACGVAGRQQCTAQCLIVPGTCEAQRSCNPASCSGTGAQTCNASTNVWSGCTGCSGSAPCLTVECGESSTASCNSDCGVSTCTPVAERCNQCDDSAPGSAGRGKVDEGLHCPACVL